MRKTIQEKLIKFATRVPVFMYLTDYRERSLKDVITQLEPELFKKVTGLDVTDFKRLCSIGVFNASLMNDAIFKFKRYEDSSLTYTGIDKHKGEDIGVWDTVIKRAEYDKLFLNQQASATVREVETPPAVNKPVKPKSESVSVTAQYGIEPPSHAVQKEQPTRFVPPDVQNGTEVIHRTFGVGTVTWLDKAGKYIRVKFPIGEKTFVFPDAFKMGFLKIKENQ